MSEVARTVSRLELVEADPPTRWHIVDEQHVTNRSLIDEHARHLVRQIAERREADARALVHASLRPRLRWATRRPRALRLLKHARLWTPPTMPLRPITLTTADMPDGTMRVTASER